MSDMRICVFSPHSGQQRTWCTSLEPQNQGTLGKPVVKPEATVVLRSASPNVLDELERAVDNAVHVPSKDVR